MTAMFQSTQNTQPLSLSLTNPQQQYHQQQQIQPPQSSSLIQSHHQHSYDINNNNNQLQPGWFQNSLKKRTIPNHLVPKKKPSFQLTSSTNDSSSNSKDLLRLKKSNQSLITTSNDQFNILSFSNNKDSKKLLSLGSLLDGQSMLENSFDATKLDDTINETLETKDVDDDLPPTKSIHEINQESNQLKNDNKNAFSDSFLTKDPKNFDNVFNKNVKVESKKDDTLAKNLNALNEKCAIIVFGYPESYTSQIIQYFRTFGKTLENFQSYINDSYSNRAGNNLFEMSKSEISNAPLFTGKNWIKLTYDNFNSASLALQENGSVFNGALLGVVPYNKTTVEKLEKRKLSDNESVGETEFNEILENNQNSILAQSSESINNQPNHINKLDIKEGSQFFINPENEKISQKSRIHDDKSKEKLTFINTVSKFIFGFHDL